MEHLPEFIENHLLLSAGFVVVLFMLIKAEFDHQTSRASQLSPANAVRLMNSDDALILDVRTASEYGSGHITNAINVPLSALQEKLKDFAPYRNKPVLVYCNSGNISTKACKILRKGEFSNVHNIAGGVQGWQDANLPLTKKQ